jgi:large subunit ribosomal protein L16
MPLMPKRTKYRKQQRGRVRGNAKGGDYLAFGDYGIQTLDRGELTSAQIEAARVAINRYLSRRGKVWIRVFPHTPITKKPLETRQGKGKGAVEYWAAKIKPGAILFELAGVPQSAAREAMRLADGKLPFRCRFVSKEIFE